MTIEMGQPAPDFTLTDHHGNTVTLAAFQGQKSVILFFVRTFSCYVCRQHVEQLGRQHQDFQAHNAEVLVIIHADADQARQYAEITQTPFPVLADPTHEVYEKFDLHKHLLMSTRTASLIINPDGNITYLKSMVNPWGWRNEAQTLLEKIQETAVPLG